MTRFRFEAPGDANLDLGTGKVVKGGEEFDDDRDLQVIDARIRPIAQTEQVQPVDQQVGVPQRVGRSAVNNPPTA